MSLLFNKGIKYSWLTICNSLLPSSFPVFPFWKSRPQLREVRMHFPVSFWSSVPLYWREAEHLRGGLPPPFHYSAGLSFLTGSLCDSSFISSFLKCSIENLFLGGKTVLETLLPLDHSFKLLHKNMLVQFPIKVCLTFSKRPSLHG